MFINLENGKLKLYDLRIYKKIDKLLTKIIFDSPYNHRVVRDGVHYYNGKILNGGKDIAYWVNSSDTGIRIEHNDSLFYPDTPIYEYSFYEYHIPNLYHLVKKIKEGDVISLQKLNSYLNDEYVDEIEVFKKYKKQILSSFKLVELVDKDCLETTLIYELLLKNSKDELKEKLIDIKEYLNIYELKIDNVPKLIKH